MSDGHDDLIDELMRIADTLDERIVDVLREAVQSGTGQRPASERHLSTARRAVDKAMHSLRRASET
jgi:hypothetical protein